jgi:hypothetical protein
MVKFATLVWRNLRRSPRQTILTILAIALAAFTYSSLSSLPNVARRMVNTPDSARRMVVMSDSGFFNRLPDSDCALRLRRLWRRSRSKNRSSFDGG